MGPIMCHCKLWQFLAPETMTAKSSSQFHGDLLKGTLYTVISAQLCYGWCESEHTTLAVDIACLREILLAKCRKKKHEKDVEIAESICAAPRFPEQEPRTTTDGHRAQAVPVSEWQRTLV